MGTDFGVIIPVLYPYLQYQRPISAHLSANLCQKHVFSGPRMPRRHAGAARIEILPKIVKLGPRKFVAK